MGAGAASAAGGASTPPFPTLFDAHFHVFEPGFPVVANGGEVPGTYTLDDYRSDAARLGIVGGALVSASFQGDDQSYLVDALERLGPRFVGVTQLPASVGDDELARLDRIGVRAVRFNLFRGGPELLGRVEAVARRVHEVVGWHAELYVDAATIEELVPMLAALPQISIDHLGLSREGLPHLLHLVEHGARVKASGFGRGDLDVAAALRSLVAVNPASVMAATDLPSTRARRPFADADLHLVLDAVGPTLAPAVFWGNAVSLYRPAAWP